MDADDMGKMASTMKSLLPKSPTKVSVEKRPGGAVKVKAKITKAPKK